MLIIFSVNDQKITHDLKGQLVAGSVDIVQAAFKFDSSWDELDKMDVLNFNRKEEAQCTYLKMRPSVGV